MYDCISWLNRNHKKSGRCTFEKVFGLWPGILYYNFRKLSEEWDDFKVLSFEKENEKWLDFVCACRKGQPLNKEYDIIIGNVADDDVFKTVDMYFRGLWDKEKVLGELRYYKMNNQICIVNQETLNRLITFKRAYEVEDHGR